MCRRIKIRKLVEDDISVNIGIQVADAIRGNSILERGLAVTAGVVGAIASFVVDTITIDIHVVIIPIASLEEESVGDVAAEDGAGRGHVRQRVLAAASLVCFIDGSQVVGQVIGGCDRSERLDGEDCRGTHLRNCIVVECVADEQ